MNVTHRARHHRHIYGMVVRGPHFHNLRKKKKEKKKRKKKKKESPIGPLLVSVVNCQGMVESGSREGEGSFRRLERDGEDNRVGI